MANDDEITKEATERAANARNDIATSVTTPEPILQFFGFKHLPAHLQPASAPFADLAQHIVRELPRNAERTVALRKLLEAKDAAVRAVLFK